MPKTSHTDETDGLFAWPEPVVIDILAERYQDIAAPGRMTIARLQASALRELYAGRPRRAATLRLELADACEITGISADRAGRADLAVFWELTQLIDARFRNSPRSKALICLKIEAALDELRTEQATRPHPQRGISRAISGALQPLAATG